MVKMLTTKNLFGLVLVSIEQISLRKNSILDGVLPIYNLSALNNIRMIRRMTTSFINLAAIESQSLHLSGLLYNS